MKLIDLLQKSNLSHSEKPAIKDDIRIMAYSELMSAVQYLSDYLCSAGCVPGTKVAIVLPNSIAYFSSFFAISATGATIVPMSSKMTDYEISGFIERADISYVLTEKKFAVKLAGHLKNKRPVTIITLEQYAGVVFKAEMFISAQPLIDSDNSNVALMIYTSGTTGQSKIVMLTDHQLISNMLAYRSTMNFCGSDVVYCALPFHHIYCICSQILTHISLGDTFIVTAAPFFVKDFLKNVQEYKVTITAFVAYLAMLLLEYPRLDEFDISSLRYITLAGAKSPNQLREKLVTTFTHVDFIDAYGMSEAGPRISQTMPRLQDCPAGSVGKPIPGVAVRIASSSGDELPAGCLGEIQVKSPSLFEGYYDRPHLTNKTMIDEWLKTGDLGTLDKEGYLYFAGREKEIILCGGENIFPAEVEETLLENDQITEAAVIGIPDEKLEEIPVAFVVYKDGRCCEMEVIHFCRKRLSSFKVPRKILFIDEIPKLTTSKINKRKLKEIALEMAGVTI